MPNLPPTNVDLPNGWDVAKDFDGKIYYIDHVNKKTTWIDPRDRYTKPQTFADCVGDELPLGWEESFDQIIGRYYINHFDQSTQLEDPRQEWKSIQEQMLREYLTSAQDVLVAKKEIYDVKNRRLRLAEDEYNMLTKMAASRSSLYSSSSSISTRHDPELLKAELAMAKERVWRLKRELLQINSDITYTQRGVDTLNSVEQKLNARENGCYNISEVQAIREEMTFADCVGDELPLGWEESFDQIIGRYYINHFDQSTQLEDPRQEWKSIQEQMLREYLTSAQDVLVAKKEIYDVKNRRLRLAEDEYNMLTKMAASRCSLYSSSSSISTRHDPELLKAELAMAKERVWRLKRELLQINSDITYTQRGVDTLNSVEQKLNARENGCYNISEVQAIREEMVKVQKSLVSGEKVKDELMRSLAQIKNELTRQQYCDSNSDYSAFMQNDKICVASQTDLCAENLHGGARFAEMAKTKFQYDEWRKHIKQLQQQLADHVDKIEPGQLESDKDRLLLIQEKEQYLKELRSIPSKSKSSTEYATIQEACQKLESDLKCAYELSNKCIADRLRLHEEKQVLLQQLQEALKSTKMLEERLKSFSSGSTFSISSGSSLGSLSTASSKNSLSLSFTDIYGDPLTTDAQVDMLDLHRRSQKFTTSSHPSEVSLSPRSSLSVETPPASPMKENVADEPTYENTKYFPLPSTSCSQQELDSTVFDCMRLEERLHELEWKQSMGMTVAPTAAPLSPIYEKPSLLNLPQQGAISRASSASNTRSVSAAVSNESVAGDSGVFEASRATLPGRDSAQVQIGLKYSKADGTIHISVERARNLHALCLSNKCQVYLKAALLPNSQQSLRTSLASGALLKPVFGNSFSVPIPLNKLYTKTLQVNVLSVVGQREEIVGCAQISLAEFNSEDATMKWYNILSFKSMHNFESLDAASGCKEESSDESTIISSQTSTLTRDQGQDGIASSLVDELGEKLTLNDDEDEQSNSGENGNGDDGSSTTEDRESTEQMLAAYINEVRNFNVPATTVDKETNTECAFPPEKSRTRDRSSLLGNSSSSKELDSIDERSVKRSQTFSPSAVVSKTRYVCRLNRSDSDSAMHFATGGHGLNYNQLSVQNPFHRGAVERRSLRFHNNKIPKSVSTKMLPIPRTSLDLELDLQAQHTKLETLNDEIEKLKNLKHRLEQAVDSKDGKIAAWAVENEDFQRLVENIETNNSPEDRKLKKLLHKTSKEIYKLRKTRLPKGQPDITSFKEKMAFFTRKGLAVPDLPSDFVLTEEPEEFSMPATPPSPSSNSTPNESTPNPSEDSGEQTKQDNRFDYVVDRNYGVEV